MAAYNSTCGFGTVRVLSKRRTLWFVNDGEIIQDDADRRWRAYQRGQLTPIAGTFARPSHALLALHWNRLVS
jgi:hypothetical protein